MITDSELQNMKLSFLIKRPLVFRGIQKFEHRALPTYTFNLEYPDYRGNWTQIGVFTSYFCLCGGNFSPAVIISRVKHIK